MKGVRARRSNASRNVGAGASNVYGSFPGAALRIYHTA